jgi:AraC-like DNA-binding protein
MRSGDEVGAGPETALVIADLSSDATWRRLIDVAPSVSLVRSHALSDEDIRGAARVVVVTDLSNPSRQGPAIGDARGGDTPLHTIIWAAFVPRLVGPVLRVLAQAPTDIVWSDKGRELPFLRQLLTRKDLPGACGRIGQIVARQDSDLPPGVSEGFLRLLGGLTAQTTARNITSQIPQSHKGVPRESEGPTRRSIERLLRLVRHARAWDALMAGASVADAARAAWYGSARAYSDAFKLLVGQTPSDASASIATAEFVNALLAVIPSEDTPQHSLNGR